MTNPKPMYLAYPMKVIKGTQTFCALPAKQISQSKQNKNQNQQYTNEIPKKRGDSMTTIRQFDAET